MSERDALERELVTTRRRVEQTAQALAERLDVKAAAKRELEASKQRAGEVVSDASAAVTGAVKGVSEKVSGIAHGLKEKASSGSDRLDEAEEDQPGPEDSDESDLAPTHVETLERSSDLLAPEPFERTDVAPLETSDETPLGQNRALVGAQQGLSAALVSGAVLAVVMLAVKAVRRR